MSEQLFNPNQPEPTQPNQPENKAVVVRKIPKLQDLINEDKMQSMIKQDDFNTLINSPVPKNWVKEHPFAKIKVNGRDVPLPYIPVHKVKWLLKRIYLKYRWEIKSCTQQLNSMVVVGTLTVTNPVTGEIESQDGVGAATIQLNAGATQGDLSSIKPNAIMLAAPAAESYALKNAAEKFGDIFGGNIYDVDSTQYTQVITDEAREQYISKKNNPKAHE